MPLLPLFLSEILKTKKVIYFEVMVAWEVGDKMLLQGFLIVY